MTPEQFHAHAMTVADEEGRLPLSRMAYWDIFPFDPAGLRTVPLEAPRVPEPPRRDTADDCDSCRARDAGIWRDDRFRVTQWAGAGVPLALMLLSRDHHDLADLPDDLARELGVITAHLCRAIEALPNIGRAHVSRWGDGGEHLHVWFLARPAGQLQLRGSCLPMWDDLLPEYPTDIAAADALTAVRALADSYGGTVVDA
jgi:hypothetical protein